MTNEFGPRLERLGVLRDLGEPPRIMNPTYRDRAISATAPVMQWWQSLAPANKELTESQAKAQALKTTKNIFGDVEADKIMDSLGILDFTPAGVIFAGNEALREYGQAEKATDYILPTVGLGLSAIEAYPLTKPLVTTATKPLRNFLGSLANKTSPEPIDMSRRTLLKGAVAAPIVAGALSQIPLSKIAKDVKPVVEKVKFNLDLSSLESFQDKSVEVPKQTHLIKEKTKTKPTVSYAEAYEKADKTKYPTLESFTKAAKEYNIKNPKKKKSTDPGFSEGAERIGKYLKKHKLEDKPM